MAAVIISCTTSSTDERTKVEASESGVMVTPGGRVRRTCGMRALMPATTASVEALPVLSTGSRTACWPCTSTMLVSGWVPR